MKKIIISLALSMFVHCLCFSQNDSQNLVKIKEELENAISHDLSLDKLQAVEKKLEHHAHQNPNSLFAHYYLAYANNQMAYRLSDKKTQLQCLDKAILHLDKSIQIDKEFAEGYILKAVVYNFMMGLRPGKVIILNGKFRAALSRAKRIEPNNPRAYIASGIFSYYAPEAYGGGITKAQAEFLKCVELFDSYKPVNTLSHNWGKDEAYGYLAQIAIKTDHTKDAVDYLKKALIVNPNDVANKSLLDKLTINGGRTK